MASLSLHFHACLAVVLCTFLQHVSANCYYPNGTDIEIGRPSDKPAGIYSPCSTDASNSMCCAWEHPDSVFLNGKSGVKCRSDGLCGSKGGDATWRDFCTDPTWQAPECIKLCTNTQVNAQVTVCGDGSYCCGGDDAGQSCCQYGLGVFVRNGAVTNISPNGSAIAASSIISSTSSATSSTSSSTISSSSATSSTSSSTLSTISSSTSSPTALAQSTSPSSQPKTRAIVGGVIGAIAFLSATAGLALYLTHRKRRREDNIPSARNSEWKFGSIGSDMVEADAENTRKFEVSGTAVGRAELGQPAPPMGELDVIPR